MSEWRVRFHKTIHSAPGVAVDMYLIRESKDGRGDVSLGVRHGDRKTVHWIVRALRQAAGQKVGAGKEAENE